MLSRVIVLSDLHITPVERLWNLPNSTGARLVAWTEWLAESGAQDAVLVLNGDIVDFLLVEDHSTSLNLSTAALRTSELLERLESKTTWGRAWRDSLRNWRGLGGRIVLLPGNHDPEWFHPDARRALAKWLAPDVGDADDEIEWHAGPWEERVGDWQVTVAHGHRSDPLNDVDPTVIERALVRGDPAVSLPPGSEFVLGPIARFKRALDPSTGKPLFPFVDALKPEAGVVFLLAYLDAPLLFNSLPQSLAPLGRMLVREVRRRLLGGPALTRSPEALDDSRDVSLAAVGALSTELATGLTAALADQDRTAPVGTLHILDELIAGKIDNVTIPGALAISGRSIREAFLRAWLRRVRPQSKDFFRVHAASAFDHAVIDATLRSGSDQHVVIAGHTHAAREIRLPGDRVYLNTGTWTTLLDLSQYGDDSSVIDLADGLARGEMVGFQRLTWAEVTPSGPKLREWND